MCAANGGTSRITYCKHAPRVPSCYKSLCISDNFSVGACSFLVNFSGISQWIKPLVHLRVEAIFQKQKYWGLFSTVTKFLISVCLEMAKHKPHIYR